MSLFRLAKSVGRTSSWLAPALLRRRTFGAAVVASLLATIYWGVIASDRYVSEAHVIIQGTSLGGTQQIDVASLIGGGTGSAEQMLLRDYLLSVDMLKTLDAELDLRGHYSDSRRDILSRMWGADTQIEWFHRHYLSRVSVEYDAESGVLVIKAEAYDPEMAHAITSRMVSEGERYMNAMAHRLASEQVGFLERQVNDLGKRNIDARQAIVAYQNAHGLVSPESTVGNIAGIINSLETRLAELRASRTALLGYLVPDNASVVELDLQISAIQKQIEQEKDRVAASSGAALNETVEQYQRLQLEAEFTQQLYSSALVALEQGRVEATRTLKQVSVLQSPTVPQYPLQPRRIYNVIVFILIALLVASIVHLLAAIIRDHKD